MYQWLWESKVRGLVTEAFRPQMEKAQLLVNATFQDTYQFLDVLLNAFNRILLFLQIQTIIRKLKKRVYTIAICPSVFGWAECPWAPDDLSTHTLYSSEYYRKKNKENSNISIFVPKTHHWIWAFAKSINRQMAGECSITDAAFSNY